MLRTIALTLVLAHIAGPALADPTPVRVRGVITAISDGAVTIHPARGDDVLLALTKDTQFSTVSPATLLDVTPGSYVGATTDVADNGPLPVAREVHIFPPALRGRGEGSGPWDAGPGAGPATMTNGAVAALVTETQAAQAGGRRLTIAYQGRESTVFVPPNAPVVALHADADRALFVPGATVFATALDDGGQFTATGLTTGTDGITPPM